MTDVMIDIETLGTGSDAVILSLGAVKFDRSYILDTFYVAIDPTSCQQYGLTIDASTVLWWMDEERAKARSELLEQPMHDLYTALDGFAQWYGTESLPTWGNGASFDNVVVRNACAKAGVECPWRFWHDRCYRTMKNLNPAIEVMREGTHHNAVADALHQAKHLQALWAAITP
jgi:DNA polymerase III epsilon subunit-like protein